MSTEHLEFRYFGFYGALRRHRLSVITGWGVTAAGMAGFIASWGITGTRGLLDVTLAVATILAGLVVVQVSVMGLQSYVNLRFPAVPPETPGSDRAALEAMELVMAAVRDGGWQEAFHALGELREIGERRGLPPPDRRGALPPTHPHQEA